MKAETANILRIAREALATARHNLDAGDTRAAVSRAYYAAFYAVTAALLEQGLAARSHRGAQTLLWGAQTLLWEHLIEPGHIEPERGRSFSRLHQLRQEGDYLLEAEIPYEKASEAVVEATSFVEAVEMWLRGADGEG